MQKLLILILVLFPLSSMAQQATLQPPGVKGFMNVKSCVMSNDPGICHQIMTPESYALFDRFYGYKLMPCLPTDFTYASEEAAAGRITVTANSPAGTGQHYVLRMVFVVTPLGLKFSLPESLHRGFGENWENKIQLSEQLYLMMKQNMGDKLTCDQLNGLLTKKQ